MSTALNFDVLHARCDSLFAMERVQEAVTLLDGQATHHSNTALYWVLLGRALVLDEQPDRAEQAALRAVLLAPNELDPQVTLLLARLGQQRFDEAVQLAARLVELHPDHNLAHYWLGRAHLARNHTRDDLIVAYQAAKHALSLEPDAGNFALAAETASFIDCHEEALGLLAAGLETHPQDRNLILISGNIKGSGRLVGDREGLLKGVLARSPLDKTAEAGLAASVVNWVRARLFLAWFHLLVFCISTLFLSAIASAVMAVVLFMAHAGWLAKSYRSLGDRLPPGYLAEQLKNPDRGRAAARLLAMAGALILIGSLLSSTLAGVVSGPAAGDFVLLAASVMISGGLLSAERALGRLAVTGLMDARQRITYQQVRFGANVNVPKSYWLALILGFVAAVVSTGMGGSATAAVATLSVAIMHIVKTIDLLVLSKAIPGEESPWVSGLALLSGSETKNRTARGRFLGVRYIAFQVLVSLILLLNGAGAFSSQL